MAEFIDDEIEVHFVKKPGPPTSFIWRGMEYKITEIKDMRRSLDFQKAWWQRRHRDYYVVKTETGEIFEIYFHRGYGRRYWVLYRRLEE
jgi:hypothetical protein